MQINTTVNTINPYERQSMVDAIAGSLPVDVLPIIFKNVKAELPHLALVCQNWRAIVDNKQFRETIHPATAFGSSEWNEYMGVDTEEEPLLPRRAYGEMEKGNYYLTFIPGKIKMTQKNEKVDEASMDVRGDKEIELDSLEVIGKLVSNSANGNIISYDQEAWQVAIKEKRTVEKSHWVLISKELIGRNKTYEDQQKLARKENKKMPGAKLSGLIDTAISLFMEYVRSPKQNFELDFANDEYNWVRVNDKTLEKQVCFGFSPSGRCALDGCEDASDEIGFVLARKTI